MQLAEGESYGRKLFSRMLIAPGAVGSGIPDNLRAGLRQLKEAFAHPIGAKATNDRAHSHVVLPGDGLLISTLHDMAPDMHEEIKLAFGGALSR